MREQYVQITKIQYLCFDLVHSRYSRMAGFGRRDIDYMQALCIYNIHIDCYAVDIRLTLGGLREKSATSGAHGYIVSTQDILTTRTQPSGPFFQSQGFYEVFVLSLVYVLHTYSMSQNYMARMLFDLFKAFD